MRLPEMVWPLVDVFTPMRVIMMNGIKITALRFGHMAARFNRELRLPLALVRRSENHQATMINWLLSPDHSPLEITIAYEQVAIELTAAVAQRGPDPYLAQSLAMGLVQVLGDPRTSLAQSLHALLTAELSDGVGWETLIALAGEHEQADRAERFGDALLQERKHQAMIQSWYEEAVGLGGLEAARTVHSGSAAAAPLDGDTIPPGALS